MTFIVPDEDEAAAANVFNKTEAWKENQNHYVWEQYSSGKARENMEKMGYRGGGLGKFGNGREEAVALEPVMQPPSLHKTVVFSSSITRGINPNGFNKVYTGKAKFERFNGRTAHDIKMYIPQHLRRDKYESAVIAAGGNDLSKDSTSIDQIASDIIEAGISCKEHGVKKVYICSILPRKPATYQSRRSTLNDILKILCAMFDFTYIENENITLEGHIDRDGVHLTKRGSSVLCRNIVKCLNDDLLTE